MPTRRAHTAPVTPSGLLNDEHGAIYVEFLIAFFPMFLFFLCLVQLTLLYAADLVVDHAATRAVRTAIVVLDDERNFYGGSALGVLTDGSEDERNIDSLFALLGMQDGPDRRHGPSAGARMQTIRNAAYVPLAALAPNPAAFAPFLNGALGREFVTGQAGDVARFAFGFGFYNRIASMITLRAEAGSDDVILDRFSGEGKVTVRVTYLFMCAIPGAAVILCEGLDDALGVGAYVGSVENMVEQASTGNVSGAAASFEQLTTEGVLDPGSEQVRTELGYAEMPWLTYALALTPKRFKMMSGEASLPNQYAFYSDVPAEEE